MHCALPPPEPPDGERPRCFRLAAVGGAQLRGGWHLSAIARLQGFSSGSPTAFPPRWSRRRVTTGSMVGRSKPGCGLCPALSFKDLHHPCWGGERGEPGLYLLHGPAGHLFLQHSGERALTGLAEGADFDNAGPASRKRRQLQRARLAGSAGSAGSGAASGATSHRWGGAWLSAHRGAAVAPCVPGDHPRRRTLLGQHSCSWIVLSSLQHDTSTRRLVPTRPRGPEWGSVGAGWGATRGQTSVSLALTACPRPSCGYVGEGLPTAAFALRSSPNLVAVGLHLRVTTVGVLHDLVDDKLRVATSVEAPNP
jgi:hypothetical protein